MDPTFLVIFTPERWNWAEKFRHFVRVSGQSERGTLKGVNTCTDHLERFNILAGLANRIAPDLKKDKAQLSENGYSDSRFHREFTALLEVLVKELYSSLDGIRLVLFSVYRKVQGVQNKSTEKLFRLAAKEAYGDGIPQDIREALGAAHSSWFLNLRRMRTELTHGQTGDCDFDEKTEKIRYFHDGLGDDHRAFVIEDIVSELNIWREGVIALEEVVFKRLFLLLEQKPLHQPCGIYKGRLYERFVTPTATLSFNDGFCHSRKWFLTSGDLQCPLKSKCGAFNREWNDETPW